MKHFINDVRKDMKTPKLPFVIGALGQNGSNPAKGGAERLYLDWQKHLEEWTRSDRIERTIAWAARTGSTASVKLLAGQCWNSWRIMAS
jgi:hypothetical protein